LFNIPNVGKKDFNELLDFLMGKIQVYRGKFLFILDNVDDFETIQSFVYRIRVLKEYKVQLLITTGQGNLIEKLDNASLIQVDSFGAIETELYYKKFLKTGELKQSQKKKVESS
jgi:hypothetical protein